VTISPKQCEIEDLKKIVKELRKKEWFILLSYTFEQRSDDLENMGYGKHIHMIIINNKPPSQVIESIHCKINKYCEKEKIDIRLLQDDKEKERTEKYMQGLKLGDKYEKSKIDIEWRKKNNLDNIYIVRGETKKIMVDVEKVEKLYEEEIIDGELYALINKNGVIHRFKI
jgi:hypothetical protein